MVLIFAVDLFWSPGLAAPSSGVLPRISGETVRS